MQNQLVKLPLLILLLNVFPIVCKAASDAAFSPAYTSRDPDDETASILRTDTMNFSVILQRISPTPMVINLSRTMSQHEANTSVETDDTSSA